MPSEKRQRQDEGRLARLEQHQMATRRSQRFRQVRSLGMLLGALLIVALLVSVLSKDDSDDVSTKGTTTTTAAESGDTPAEIALPKPGASVTGTTPCPAADGSSERTTTFEQAPPTCIEADRSYTATLETTEGTIVMELDHTAAPATVNNFVVLARYHFYDGVAFHRIIPGFMNQAGDPVGPTPGQGGPGYTIPDELPTGEAPYPAGTLAMANTGAPNSGGSQWFITVADGGARLTPTYTVFGRVAEGQDVVDAINALGSDGEAGEPKKLVTITSITIDES